MMEILLLGLIFSFFIVTCFSSDHPFNPHVFLRSTLSREDMMAVLQGISPPHLANKASKRVSFIVVVDALIFSQRNSRKKKSVSLTPTFSRVANGDYGVPYSQQLNSGPPPTNSLIPFNLQDGHMAAAGTRNSDFFAGSGNHLYSPFAASSIQGHSTGDIPGLVHGSQVGIAQQRGKVKSKSVHDVSYHYGGSFREGQMHTRERNSSDHHQMYAIGDSHLGRLGLPDPDAPVFIPGLFRK